MYVEGAVVPDDWEEPPKVARRLRVSRWLSRFLHNVVAHPLLVLCPPVGEWLHERTDP